MKEPIDCVLVVFSQAIIGALLWANSLKVLMITEVHTPSVSSLRVLSLISVSVLMVGGAWHLWTRTRIWRSATLGLTLAPLTGWSIAFVYVALAFVAVHAG